MAYVANMLGLLIAGLFLAAVGIADYFTPWSMSFTLFYLLPICLATLCGGRKMGVLFAVMAGLSTCFFQQMPLPDLVVAIWNFAAKFGVFLAFVLLLDLYVKKIAQTWAARPGK